MPKPTCFEPKLSKEHPWVQAQEDAQVYIFSRFEAGMPEVRCHNENACKSPQKQENNLLQSPQKWENNPCCSL